MPVTNASGASSTTNAFTVCLNSLKAALPYAEDNSFSWEAVVGLLVIQLTNTDSINKARSASHATQIQLTSERDASEGARKTEDFFPTLTLNSTFKQWRISIPARLNNKNIDELSELAYEHSDNWRADSIQIRRRILNDDGQGNGNPTLHICYGDDLMPLRELLNVGDYLVIVKCKDSALYEAAQILDLAKRCTYPRRQRPIVVFFHSEISTEILILLIDCLRERIFFFMVFLALVKAGLSSMSIALAMLWSTGWYSILIIQTQTLSGRFCLLLMPTSRLLMNLQQVHSQR